MKELQRITNAKTAAALANARQRFLVLKLVERDRSLRDLSDLSGSSLSLLHYHMGRLQKLGLVEISHRKPRSGRDMKYYRATAKAYFVPAHLVSHARNDELMASLRAGLDRANKMAEGDGVLYTLDEQAGLRMQVVRGNNSIPILESWTSLQLSSMAAQTLADELRSLLARYRQRESKTGRTYLIHCALAPVDLNRRYK
jgi:hypothetical protein